MGNDSFIAFPGALALACVRLRLHSVPGTAKIINNVIIRYCYYYKMIGFLLRFRGWVFTHTVLPPWAQDRIYYWTVKVCVGNSQYKTNLSNQ